MTQTIEIHTRTEDTATVDGQLIHRGHFATIYDAAMAQTVTRAQELGAAVLVKATDGVTTHQTFWVKVLPNGTVEPAEGLADDPLSSASTPRAGGRRHRPETEGFDESDFYPSAPQSARHTDSVDPTIVTSAPWSSTPPTEPAQPTIAVVPEPRGVVAPTGGESQSPTPTPMQDQFTRHAKPDPRTGPLQAQQPLSSSPREPYRQQQSPTWPGTQPQQLPHGAHHQAPQHGPWVPQQPLAPQAPPSLADLRASRPDAPESPATTGWRGGINRATAGLFKLAPSEEELRLRRARDAVQRSLRGPRTVVVINTKGGGGKTTAVYSLAATFGQARGGYVLGWDNNETRGTLAWRSAPARHTNTAVDLLRDLERFEDPRNARVGDLDNYVRAQGSAQFDVLASDENAASAASIDDAAFRALHRSLSRFYRILVIDTGNNVKAPNWGAAVDLADQLVVVSSVREDTAGGASWTLDHLTEIGLGDKVRNAVTILSAPKAAADPDQRAMQARFREHFAARTRTVLDVPFDPALVDGDSIVFEALSPATRQAWLIAAAAIAEGL